MTPRFSGHFSIFGQEPMPETDLVWFFVLRSLLGIARRCSRETFAILALKPRSHVRIYRTCAIDYVKTGCFAV